MWWQHDFPPNVFTTASPKLWGSGGDLTIFVSTRRYIGDFDVYQRGASLAIFDRYGRPLHGEELECPGQVSYPDPSLVDPFKFLDPTVAIVDAARFRQPGRVIMIVASNFCAIHAFRWEPSALNVHTNHGLVPLWSQPMSGLLLSSPTVLSNNNVVVGTSNNHVLIFDLLTGKQFGNFSAGGPVLGTAATFGAPPVFFMTQIQYVFSIRLDVFGVLSQVKNFKLPGFTVGSPALSNGAVYVTDDKGLHILGLDLSWAVTEPNFGGRNTSSPAIGPDGTLYVVLDRSLVAFGP